MKEVSQKLQRKEKGSAKLTWKCGPQASNRAMKPTLVVVVETNYIIMQKTHECLLIEKKKKITELKNLELEGTFPLTPLQLPPCLGDGSVE